MLKEWNYEPRCVRNNFVYSPARPAAPPRLGASRTTCVCTYGSDSRCSSRLREIIARTFRSHVAWVRVAIVPHLFLGWGSLACAARLWDLLRPRGAVANGQEGAFNSDVRCTVTYLSTSKQAVRDPTYPYSARSVQRAGLAFYCV